jgi:aminoglycoside 6'-N-acetyltransferase
MIISDLQNITIETERLILSPLTLEDEDDLLEYQSDPDTVRYIPWPARTRIQVREALGKVVTPRTFEVAGDHLDFAWRLRDSGKVIGQSNIGIQSVEHQTGEIGWVVHPKFAGQGFAKEATHGLIDFAFTTAQLRRLVAYMDQRNSASARLAEALGMRREAAYRKDEFFKGEWCDSYLYAILREEWR